MLMFREEKSPEDEIKAWQFWHSRQHSVKQRILDAGKFYSSYTTPRNVLKNDHKCHNITISHNHRAAFLNGPDDWTSN